MATVYFSLSNKTTAVGTRQIMIRFCHGRIDQRAKSGLFINFEYWDGKQGQIVIPRFRVVSSEQRATFDELADIQKQLAELKAYIIKEFVDAGAGQFEITKNWLKSIVHQYLAMQLNIDDNNHTLFFNAWDNFIDSKRVSAQRIAMFKVVRNMMWRYEQIRKIRDSQFKLSFEKLTPALISDFETFLQNEYKYIDMYPAIYKGMADNEIPKARGWNTISDRIAILRTFIIWALNNDLTTNNPFKKHEIKQPIYGTPIYISIDERNQLYNTNMSSASLNRTRDIFVFQCLIGCRVGDLLKMTKANVINGAVEYIPRKTKEGRPKTVRVPLNSIAQQILQRYKDEKRAALLPFISAQKYNDNIKECFKEAGLNRFVTVINQLTREPEQKPLYEVASSHMARRTFVGNLYKQVKDPNLIGSLSGHVEGSKAFARYRDIDEGMKSDLVKLLE